MAIRYEINPPKINQEISLSDEETRKILDKVKLRVSEIESMGPVSVISKDITEPGMYGGFPPVPYKDFIKNQTSTATLFEMRKSIKKIQKKMDSRI